jgi:hypothetical protein
MSKLKFLPIIMAGIALNGCASQVETRVNSAGTPDVKVAKYMIATAPDVADEATLKRTQALIMDALATKGMTSAEGAATAVLRVAISARPATLKLSPGNLGGKQNDLSAKVNKQRGARCINREYRLVVDLTQISDGASLYHVSAAEFHCKKPIEAVIPNLVDAAMQDFGTPRGYYVIKRKQH